VKQLLLPLSLVYKGLTLLDRKLTKPVRLSRPAVSVGNITWGGTGKTPVVIALANELSKSGMKVAVLTRGYFRKERSEKSLVVSDGKNILADIEEAGDEPFLIADKLRGCAVISGPDRILSSQVAADLFNPDIFILDDGFQHWKIERDADIVCINALNPFGNGLLIPAGILREGLGSLKRADEIIITNADIVREEQVKDIEYKISQHSDVKPLKAKYNASIVYKMATGELVAAAGFAGKPVTALSAVGENDSFKRLLERCGLQVEQHFAFRDHHWYNGESLAKIFGAGRPVFTTEKDAVKLKKLLTRAGSPEDIYVIGSEMSIMNGGGNWQEFAEKIKRYL
jgi:tetraacyldisaccharide 4'-kinase